MNINQSIKKSTVGSNKIKKQLDDFFAPWLLKKWREDIQKYSFFIEINDSVSTTKKDEIKDAAVHLYVLKPSENEIEITSSELNDYANSPNPLILLVLQDTKYSYLLFTEHYLNTLFSENPSRTAQDKFLIPIKRFTSLTKTRIKEFREFVFKWKKLNYSILESGTYFKLKDGLKDLVIKTIIDIESLNIDINLETLKDIENEINKAIYTVAIVGPTKAGKSTIINSLVSKNVSPIDIRPTTGIPTSIVPGKEEKAEILLKSGEIITGKADDSFLNQYVAIDKNRSNYKGVKMVTVWVKSTQMEKGLSFCDFPGLDDADPVIEKTVTTALQYVNAIIYVIDASGMPKGFKFPKQYRDDLLSLKNKDRIFLVINKIDDFTDNKLLDDFKAFIDEKLEELKLKEFLPFPPIYMVAKKSFEQRQKGNFEKDEMTLLEEQVWDHLLANSKSGLHNLMNIIGQVNIECDRISRTLHTRMLNGDKQMELSNDIQSIKQELSKITHFEKEQRKKMNRWLYDALESEKNFLIAHYKSYLQGISLNHILPDNRTIQTYLIDQFALTAPDIFEQLENKITKLNNELNNWVNSRLQSIEITIDTYSKIQFKNSEEFDNLLRPIANIFSESYNKEVPTGLIGNIFYHIFNTINTLGDWLWEIFTNKQVVRNRKVNSIINKLEKCYNEIFEKMYSTFDLLLNTKCDDLLSKVVVRTDIYIAGLNKQIKELNNPLSDSEKKIYNMACDKLSLLDSQCGSIKLQIDEYSIHLKPKSPLDSQKADKDIELIEKTLRRLINDVITKQSESNEAKKLIPTHIQSKINERINKFVRDHPQTKQAKFYSLESNLQYFDFSEYYDIISCKSYWPLFDSTFNNKENLNKHIIQLSNLRNSIRHTRELTNLIVAEGEASILWFKMALKIK
jgi:GTPase SAR1 family protein